MVVGCTKVVQVLLMIEFEPELDSTFRTYLDQQEFIGDLVNIEFHYDVIDDNPFDPSVKITAIMFGGSGSTTNIFNDLSPEQQQDRASEIETAIKEENQEYYSHDNQMQLAGDAMRDDTALH